MQIPNSIEILNDLDWKAFEAFATGTLQRYYAPHRVDVFQTRSSHDGGRDGEGIYTIGDGSLTIVYRIWIEVKKRSGQNVTLDDIGKNLVLASNEDDVRKLIVVTNNGYAPQVEREIQRFASRNRMAYGLLDGNALLELAHTVWDYDLQRPEARSNPTEVEVELSFSRQPNPLDPKQAADLALQHGDPVFLIVTAKRTDRGPTDDYTIDVSPTNSDLTVIPYTSASYSLGSGDHARVVFVVLGAVGEMSESTFRIDVRDKTNRPAKTQSRLSGRCRVLTPLLSPWVPPSRKQLLDRWATRTKQWAATSEGGLLSFAIVAYPGVGKSLLLNRIRSEWLKDRVGEIYLDGALQSRDADVASTLFDLAFPLNPHLLGADTAAGVEQWLTGCGLDLRRAKSLAAVICSHHCFDAALCDGKELAELCACLLRRLSSFGPIVVVLEDLHFCQPSAIDLLIATHRIFERFGDVHVAFFCTTRQFAATPNATVQTDWWNRLNSFFESTLIEKTTIEAFDRDEAVAVLQQTIPTLQKHYADVIIEQVGCTPLGLREAVAYFRTVGVVEYDPVLDQLIADPDRLTETVASGVLKKATISRIAALKRRYPVWLADLLDGAACVGRYFTLHTVLPSGWVWDTLQNDALQLCEELDVIRPFEDGLYVFDHDMIRTAIVEGLSSGRQQRIAATLCDREQFHTRPEERGWLLYQAGRFRDSVGVLKIAANRAIQSYRFADAMKALRLCLTCVDPETSTRIASMADMDIAVVHAVQPKPKQPADNERHEVMDILFALLSCTGSTAVFTNRIADSLLSEATMLARRYDDRQRLADLRAMTGIRYFERDELRQAVAAHEEAEGLYAEVGGDTGPRAANLLRLAITQRQQNQLETSQATIRRAHRMMPPGDLDLLVKLILNAGASYLAIDLNRVRRYWYAALRTANRAALTERRIHALIDVGYLELLLNHNTQAAACLSEGYRLAEELGLENSAMRGALNLACMNLIRGDIARATDLLIRAEEIGMRQGIGRRLWRVRANLATALEASGELQQAYAIDSRLAKELRIENHFGGSAKRVALPYFNIALRALDHEAYRALFDTLDQNMRTLATTVRRQIMAGDSFQLPELLKGHLRMIGGLQRFVVTE